MDASEKLILTDCECNILRYDKLNVTFESGYGEISQSRIRRGVYDLAYFCARGMKYYIYRVREGDKVRHIAFRNMEQYLVEASNPMEMVYSKKELSSGTGNFVKFKDDEEIG